MRKWLTLFLLFSAVVLEATTPLQFKQAFAKSALAPHEEKLLGIYLVFPTGIANAQKDKLHRKWKTMLTSRFSPFQIDAVVPRKSGFSVDSLNSLCGQYLKSEELKSCQLNWTVEPAEMSHAERTHSENPMLTPRPATLVGPPDPAVARACRVGEKPRGASDLGLPGASAYWDREYIGADLAGEFMVRNERVGVARVAVVDTSFRRGVLEPFLSERLGFEQPNEQRPNLVDHGTAVCRLIADRTYYGSSSARLDALEDIDSSAGLLNACRRLLRISDNPPHLVNVSLRIPNDRDIGNAMEQVARRSVIIHSLGNRYPQRTEIPPNLNVIQVGSLNPYGHLSYFTSSAEEADVLVPADQYQIYRTGRRDEEFDSFGGTSGAAPLVTAALSDVVGLLGPLSTDEARKLLKRTGIPWSGGRLSMLNRYKLVRVAARIRQAFQTNRAILDDWQQYDFTTDAQQIFDNAAQEWDSFQRAVAQGQAVDCDRFRTLINRMREVFLLVNDQRLRPSEGHPGIPAALRLYEQSRERLIALYRAAGLPINAEFYENFDEGASHNNIRAKILDRSRNLGLRASAIRSLEYSSNSERALELARLALRDVNGDIVGYGIRAGAAVSYQTAYRTAAQDREVRGRRAVAQFLGSVLPEISLEGALSVGLVASELPDEARDMFDEILTRRNLSTDHLCNTIAAIDTFAASGGRAAATTLRDHVISALRRSDSRAWALVYLETMRSPETVRALVRIYEREENADLRSGILLALAGQGDAAVSHLENIYDGATTATRHLILSNVASNATSARVLPIIRRGMNFESIPLCHRAVLSLTLWNERIPLSAALTREDIAFINEYSRRINNDPAWSIPEREQVSRMIQTLIRGVRD